MSEPPKRPAKRINYRPAWWNKKQEWRDYVKQLEWDAQPSEHEKRQSDNWKRQSRENTPANPKWWEREKVPNVAPGALAGESSKRDILDQEARLDMYRYGCRSNGAESDWFAVDSVSMMAAAWRNLRAAQSAHDQRYGVAVPIP